MRDPLHETLRGIADSLGADLKLSDLKGIGRALEKIRTDYAGQPGRIKDLLRAGFTPLVREASVQGKILYRVFAATGLDRDSAARLLERLRAAGYAGITVSD